MKKDIKTSSMVFFQAGIGHTVRSLWRFYTHQFHSCQRGKSGRLRFLTCNWSFLQTLLEHVQKGQPTGLEHASHFSCFWHMNEMHIFLHCAPCVPLLQGASALTDTSAPGEVLSPPHLVFLHQLLSMPMPSSCCLQYSPYSPPVANIPPVFL